MYSAELKNIGKLFSIEDVRGIEIYGLIVNVFLDEEENTLYKVLSGENIYEIDINEYEMKFYE